MCACRKETDDDKKLVKAFDKVRAGAYGQFFEAVCIAYPASSIIDPVYAGGGFLAFLDDPVITPTTANLIQRHFPALHRLVVDISPRWPRIPQGLVGFLRRIAKRSSHPCKQEVWWRMSARNAGSV